MTGDNDPGSIDAIVFRRFLRAKEGERNARIVNRVRNSEPSL
jgi:hypothetical protein